MPYNVWMLLCRHIPVHIHLFFFFLQFTCSPGDMMQVKEGLEEKEYTVTYASTEYIPIFPANISEKELDQLSVIVQKLENVDDVLKVHVNL